MCVLSHVQLFKTPWTVTRQAPLSIEFPRQEHWSGLTFPSLRDLPDAGIEPASLVSPALAGRFFTTRTTWEAHVLQPKMPYHTAETSCASTTTWRSQMNECLKRRRQCKGDYGIEVPSIYPPDPVSILSTSVCFLRGVCLAGTWRAALCPSLCPTSLCAGLCCSCCVSSHSGGRLNRHVLVIQMCFLHKLWLHWNGH